MHKHYDWNRLINHDARERMVLDVDKLIERGQFWENSPKFQTNVNIFGLQSQDWVNLKMSFIWSCFAYLEKEVQIKNIQSWSYRTSLKHPEDRDILWHNHDHNPETKTVSGVYYLHLPMDAKDLRTAGTELAPEGPDKEGKYFVDWRTGHWMIYPGRIWHRPGILQSHDDRFIVAADLEF